MKDEVQMFCWRYLRWMFKVKLSPSPETLNAVTSVCGWDHLQRITLFWTASLEGKRSTSIDLESAVFYGSCTWICASLWIRRKACSTGKWFKSVIICSTAYVCNVMMSRNVGAFEVNSVELLFLFFRYHYHWVSLEYGTYPVLCHIIVFVIYQDWSTLIFNQAFWQPAKISKKLEFQMSLVLIV